MAAVGSTRTQPCSVGVRLTHGEVTVDRIDFSALIAGNHARRNTCRAHEEDVGRGKVFAESAPCGEEEFVDGVLAKQGGLKRIKEGFLPEKAQCRY